MRRRKRRNKQIKKMTALFVILLLALGMTGFAYSHWSTTLNFTGIITTGTWEKEACIRIMKVLNGSFTNATTGEDLTEPTNLIHVGTQTDPGFPTKFQLIIVVENCGPTTLDDTVAVTDIIKNTVAPLNWTASKGDVSWDEVPDPEGGFTFDHLSWTIGELALGESAYLEIWIVTLRNPSLKYEPTSENQDIEINEGATVSANIPSLGSLSATTEGITLTIVDEDIPDNPNLAVITPTLPYSTPWAEDSIIDPS